MSSTEIISSTEEAAPKTEKANFDDEFADLLGDFGGGGGGGDASQVVVENGHGDTEEFVNIGAPEDGSVQVKTTTMTASVDADTVVVSQTTDVVDYGAVTKEPEAVHDNEVTTHAEVLHDGDVITEEHHQQQDQELNPSVTIRWDTPEKEDPLDAYGIGNMESSLSEGRDYRTSASLSPIPNELLQSTTEPFDELLDDFPETIAPKAEQEDTDIDDLSPIVAYNTGLGEGHKSRYYDSQRSSGEFSKAYEANKNKYHDINRSSGEFTKAYENNRSAMQDGQRSSGEQSSSVPSKTGDAVTKQVSIKHRGENSDSVQAQEELEAMEKTMTSRKIAMKRENTAGTAVSNKEKFAKWNSPSKWPPGNWDDAKKAPERSIPIYYVNESTTPRETKSSKSVSRPTTLPNDLPASYRTPSPKPNVKVMSHEDSLRIKSREMREVEMRQREEQEKRQQRAREEQERQASNDFEEQKKQDDMLILETRKRERQARERLERERLEEKNRQERAQREKMNEERQVTEEMSSIDRIRKEESLIEKARIEKIREEQRKEEEQKRKREEQARLNRERLEQQRLSEEESRRKRLQQSEEKRLRDQEERINQEERRIQLEKEKIRQERLKQEMVGREALDKQTEGDGPAKRRGVDVEDASKNKFKWNYSSRGPIYTHRSQSYNSWIEFLDLFPDKYQLFDKALKDIPKLAKVQDYEMMPETSAVHFNSSKSFAEKASQEKSSTISKSSDSVNKTKSPADPDAGKYSRSGKSSGKDWEARQKGNLSEVDGRQTTNQSRYRTMQATPPPKPRRVNGSTRTRSASMERRIQAYNDSVDAAMTYERPSETELEEHSIKMMLQDDRYNQTTPLRSRRDMHDESIETIVSTKVDVARNSRFRGESESSERGLHDTSFADRYRTESESPVRYTRSEMGWYRRESESSEPAIREDTATRQSRFDRSFEKSRKISKTLSPQPVNSKKRESSPSPPENVDYLLPASELVAKYEAMHNESDLDVSFRGSETSEVLPYNSVRNEIMQRTGVATRKYKSSFCHHDEKSETSSLIGKYESMSKFSDTSSVISAADMVDIASEVQYQRSRSFNNKRQESGVWRKSSTSPKKKTDTLALADQFQSMSQHSLKSEVHTKEAPIRKPVIPKAPPPPPIFGKPMKPKSVKNTEATSIARRFEMMNQQKDDVDGESQSVSNRMPQNAANKRYGKSPQQKKSYSFSPSSRSANLVTSAKRYESFSGSHSRGPSAEGRASSAASNHAYPSKKKQECKASEALALVKHYEEIAKNEAEMSQVEEYDLALKKPPRSRSLTRTDEPQSNAWKYRGMYPPIYMIPPSQVGRSTGEEDEVYSARSASVTGTIPRKTQSTPRKYELKIPKVRTAESRPVRRIGQAEEPREETTSSHDIKDISDIDASMDHTDGESLTAGEIARKFQALADEAEISAAIAAENSLQRRSEISVNKRVPNKKTKPTTDEVDSEEQPAARSIAQRFEAMSQKLEDVIRREDEIDQRVVKPVFGHGGKKKKRYGAMAKSSTFPSTSAVTQKTHSGFDGRSLRAPSDVKDGSPERIDFSKCKSKVSAKLSMTLLQKYDQFTKESEASRSSQGSIASDDDRPSSVSKDYGGQSQGSSWKTSKGVTKTTSMPVMANSANSSSRKSADETHKSLARILRRSPPPSHLQHTLLLNKAISSKNQDPGAWIGGEKPADSDDEAGRETVRSEADEEPRGSSFVDTLSDYQPPRRVTKEDKKESGRAASVVIMDSESVVSGNQTSIDAHSELENTSHPFGSLLAGWRTSNNNVTNEETDVVHSANKGSAKVGGAAENMCKVCGKRVYEMEKMLADKAIYHKICFKCIHCNRVLNLNNFASLDGNMYCKPHFMELFKAKGNYEEGFGKERHRNQWASGEAASTRKEPAAAAAVVAEETEAQPADIIRADEKPEDDRENLPSIRNLKSRFESQENDSTENLARGRKYGSGDVNTQGEKEQRPKQTQVSTQFYEPEAAPAPAGSTKKPSKWDKAKEAPPPPINRVSEDSSEDATDNDLPPTSMARNLVSRFQDIGKGDEDRGPEVKPVRKMTPPREEVGRDVEEFHRQREEAMEASFDANIVRSGEPLPSEQEELPAPSTTKNLLARFKSMEDMSSAPITPIWPTTSSSTISSKKVSRAPVTVETTTVVNVQQVNHISPDSGVAVSESDTYTSAPSASHIQHEEVVEGGVYENEPVRMEDVFRESDVDEEKELPEQGFTRNLLAQWRHIENKTGTPPPQVEKPSTSKTQSWSYKDSSKAKSNVVSKSVEEVRAVENGLSPEAEPTEQVVREVVRESDNSEEQFLPPPAYTKNILQRFKSMETQEPSSSGPGATPKRFKWQVKEARHLAWPGSPTSAPGEADPINYDNLVRAEDQMESEDSKPAPATTRSLLSRFQVDTNAPPPTPEESTKKQQAAVKSLKHVPTHDSPAPAAHHQEEPSEHNGQPDAGEYENEPQRQEDVVRESDMTEEEELPGQGTTKNLLAKFQSMQPT